MKKSLALGVQLLEGTEDTEGKDTEARRRPPAGRRPALCLHVGDALSGSQRPTGIIHEFVFACLHVSGIKKHGSGVQKPAPRNTSYPS